MAKGAPPPSKGTGKGSTYKEKKEAELREKEDKLSAEQGFSGKELTVEEKKVIDEKGTETPGTGEYEKFAPQRGYFACRKCGKPIYSYQAKFDSGCGWPAFDKCYVGSVATRPEDDGSDRVEITCTGCGGHLGHVFVESGQHPRARSDQRHCANSRSLQYVKHDPPALEEAVLELSEDASGKPKVSSGGSTSAVSARGLPEGSSAGSAGAVATHVLLETKGDGVTFPRAGDVVAIHYTGKLLVSDVQFDTSRDGDPFEFTVGGGGVIQGWDEGVRQIPLGADGLLLVPAASAYGERGVLGVIPPNSDLLFQVQLVSINGQKAAPDFVPGALTSTGFLHRSLTQALGPCVAGLLRERPADPCGYLYSQLHRDASGNADLSPALAVAIAPQEYAQRVLPLLQEMSIAVLGAQDADQALPALIAWLEHNAHRRLPEPPLHQDSGDTL